MKKHPVFFSDRFYTWLLFALPADIRREFGEDMAQLFRDQRAANPGLLDRLRLWIAALGDITAEAASARAERWRGIPIPRRPSMRTFLFDFKHGFRLMRRYPSSTLLAILTLAIGIGATTAIFSVLDAVVLRKLPYEDPDKLVMVWEKREREGVLNNVVAAADFLDWRRLNPAFTGMAAVVESGASLTGSGEPVQLDVGAASWQFFDVLGVKPALGRAFVASDEVFNQHRVAVITDRLWKRQFGGDPNIVGKNVTLNGNSSWQVIGVLPPSFRFVNQSLSLWVPLLLESPNNPAPRASHNLDVYARLKPGVSLTQARDAMARIGADLEAQYPDTNRGHSVWVTTMREEFVGPVQSSLVLLFAAVGLVLLIACVNVANLLLARAASRRREMAVRSALGASRGRLISQTLIESGGLALVGGVLGIGVAFLTLRMMPTVLPSQLSVVSARDLGLDARVLAFAFGISLLTCALFGALPALQSSRTGVAGALAEGGRGAATVRRRSRMALVVGEVALATLTLVGAGLVIRSFATIMAQPLGFDPRGRTAVMIAPVGGRYTDPQVRTEALAEIEQRFAAIPGVTAIGGVSFMPLSDGDSRTGIGFEGRVSKPDDPPTRMHPRPVTPGYFAAMGIPIVKGRGLLPTDDSRAEPVVVVSEASVRRFWPEDDPIGSRLRFGGDQIWRRVVGVAGDVRHWGLTRQTNPMLYWPEAQSNFPFLNFVLKSDRDKASLAPDIRAALKAMDPNLPVANLESVEHDLVARSVRAERAQMILLSAFAVVALLLAVIGIYGVMAQLVLVRVAEIGVRMSLGARPAMVMRQILGEGAWQAVAGVAIGLIAGALLMRYASTLLFQVKPWDPTTLATVAAVLIVAALAACAIPARRAMRVDPVTALRG